MCFCPDKNDLAQQMAGSKNRRDSGFKILNKCGSLKNIILLRKVKMSDKTHQHCGIYQPVLSHFVSDTT